MDALFINPVLAATITTVIGTAWLLLSKYSGHDPREPPLAPFTSLLSRVPFIGHLIGMSSRKYEYFGDLARASESPIFTIQLPGKKMYIITKPDLVQQAQRKHLELSFTTLALDLTVKMSGVSDHARDLSFDGMYTDGYYHTVHAAMVQTLLPSSIDEMSRIAVKNVEKMWEDISPATPADKKRIKVKEWLSYTVTMASARSVYGDNNPFETPGIVKAFWEWTDGLVPILLGFYPNLTVPRAIAAREKVVKAYAAYHAAGHHNSASSLAEQRYNLGIRHGVSPDDLARYEATLGLAIFINTPVSTFWMFYHVYSDPELLADVRAELDACIGPASSAGIKTISVEAVKESCLLLQSTWREFMRYRAVGMSPREVTEDTELGGYLLKKGSLVQMPTRLVHQDKSLWGETALEFDARRFMPENKKKNGTKESSFRAFGGGKTLCPGRHLALNEVLGAVALFVARYDLTPASGKWQEPECWNTPVALALMEPDVDIEADITIRKGEEGVQWKLVA